MPRNPCCHHTLLILSVWIFMSNSYKWLASNIPLQWWCHWLRHSMVHPLFIKIVTSLRLKNESQIFAFQIYLKCWIIILYMQRWRSKIVGTVAHTEEGKESCFFKTQGIFFFFDNKFTPFGTSILMFWSNCVTIFTHKVFKENEGLAMRDINCKESQQLLDEKNFIWRIFCFLGPSHSRQTNHQIKHRFCFPPSLIIIPSY